jgi:hypothetical protein
LTEFFFPGPINTLQNFPKKENCNHHFFGGEILPLGSKKRLAANHTKVFFWESMTQYSHISKCFLKSPVLDHWF